MFRKRLVPGAGLRNTVKLLAQDSGCCDAGYTECKYRVEYTDLTTLTAITISDGGENTAWECDCSGAADAAACIPIIRATLKSAGFISDDTPGSVPKDVTLFTADDGTTYVEFWGEAVIVSLAVDAGTALATALCASYVDCLYEAVVAVGAIAWTVDGVAADSGTYATGAGATLAADILASVDEAYDVTVTEADDEYTISFRAKKATVAFNTVAATRSDCKQNYEAVA